MNNEIIILKSVFGSHLYGTSSESSDKDFKGIFIPNKRDILLGRIPYQYSTKRKKKEGEKNKPDDVDEEIFSLHKFIKLSCEGQTLALDMLHTPENMILYKNEIWDTIVKNRDKFYTKNLHAFIGYAQRQAAKYGVKGSRLDAAKYFYNFLISKDYNLKLKNVWDEIEEGEHIKFIESSPNGIKQIIVCGKIFQETSYIHYIIPIIRNFYDTYGEKAKLASLNKGIDWKAISHAVRAAFEIRELLTENTITFPLKEAELIKKIKYGKLDYTTEACPLLEELIDECKELSKKSNLPEKVDRTFWDNFIIQVLENIY